MIKIVDEKPYLIAEVAQAHDGSLGFALSFIDLAKTVGAHAVKFQMHFAAIESSTAEPWRVKFSKQDETRFDYWKRMEFTPDQWMILKSHCDEVGLDFLCSPFSQFALDLLLDMDVKVFKVASGEVNNFLLLDSLDQKAEQIILSTGMSSEDEIAKAYSRISNPAERLVLMQCTSEYPTPLDAVNLNSLDHYRRQFPAAHYGLSDHSAKVATSVGAFHQGARIFELHLCFHKLQFGPDTVASLTPDEFTLLAELLADSAVLVGPQRELHGFSEMKRIFGKSLTVRRDMGAGEVIRLNDLETKKPADAGIHASNYETIIGKRLVKSLRKGEFLQSEHITR